MSVSVETYFNHNYPSFSKMPSLFRQGVISLFKKLFHEDEINDVLKKNRHLDSLTLLNVVKEILMILTICCKVSERI
jgi:hypothetical protein